MSQRTEQVAAKLKKTLGEIFTRDLELPEDHLVTISRIDVPPDLKTAKVYISILPYDSSEEIMVLLQRKRVMLQQEASKRLEMKFSPVLEFIHDKQPEEASVIERLIDEEVGLFDL